MPSADTTLIINTLQALINQRTSELITREAQGVQAVIGQIQAANAQAISIGNNNTALIRATLESRLAQISGQLNNNNALIIGQLTQAIEETRQRLENLLNQSKDRILEQIQQATSQSNANFQQIRGIILQQFDKSIGETRESIERLRGDIITKIAEFILLEGGGGSQPSFDFLGNMNSLIGTDLIDIGGLLGLGGTVGDNIFSKITNFFVDIGRSVVIQIMKIDAVVTATSRGQFKTADEFLRAFDQIGTNTSIIKNVLTIVQFIPTLIAISGILSKPFLVNVDRLVREEFDLEEYKPAELLKLLQQGFIGIVEYNREMNNLGYDFDQALLLSFLRFNPLPPETANRLFLRGFITQEHLDETLRMNGMWGVDQQAIKQAAWQIPPISDLIRFAVKEVFTPEIANQFGMFQEFPQAILPHTRGQGLSDEWSRAYWASHWDLPSPSMGYEMLHRGIINQTQLRDLLKALDVMPFWRDKLIALSYNPLTRVDVRRMYDTGVINKQEVYQSYLNVGYSPTDANRLTEYTIRWSEGNDDSDATKLKLKTRAVIEKAYARGILSRAEAKRELVELKYHPDDVELFLELIDYDEYIRLHPDRSIDNNNRMESITLSAYRRKAISRDDALEQLLISGYTENDAETTLDYTDLEYATSFKVEVTSSIKEMYLVGVIDNVEVQSKLASLDFTPNEINQLLGELQILKDFRNKKPTHAQFTTLFKKGFIGEQEYADELRLLGYAEAYIPHMLNLAGIEGEY